MKRHVWSLEEIQDLLVAANQASSSSVALFAGDVGQHAELARAYRQGFCSALTTLALAFGLTPLATQAFPRERG